MLRAEVGHAGVAGRVMLGTAQEQRGLYLGCAARGADAAPMRLTQGDEAIS